MIQKAKEVAKFLVALLGALLVAGTTFIPGDWAGWLGLLLAVLTAAATYTVPNAPPAGTTLQD